MNMQRRGLGRGLGALLGDSRDISAFAAETVREIPVERIRPNPHQPRKRFDSETLGELQNSIAEHGVLVPILVRELEDGYELIAGERRWRACAALQRATVPAIVRAAGERDSLEVAIVENLQREDLNALEEAQGLAELVEAHGYTQEQVARRLGKSRPAVANALRLLTLSEPIKALIAEGKLGGAHARALLPASEELRLPLAQRAVSDDLSVRVLEKIVAAAQNLSAGVRKRKGRALSANDREFEDRLRTRLGAPVSLRRVARGGNVEIRFADEPDLIRIAEILLGES